jgi:hypothetical protein
LTAESLNLGDTRAAINIGPFSRGGYSRSHIQASDHDFAPTAVLKLFGVFLPAYDESFLYFTESSVTPDFMFDVLEELRPELDRRFNLHTFVINSDNGPENSSRTQFVRRAAEFAFEKEITVRPAYYPPCRSKKTLSEIRKALSNMCLAADSSEVVQSAGNFHYQVVEFLFSITKYIFDYAASFYSGNDMFRHDSDPRYQSIFDLFICGKLSFFRLFLRLLRIHPFRFISLKSSVLVKRNIIGKSEILLVAELFVVLLPFACSAQIFHLPVFRILPL